MTDNLPPLPHPVRHDFVGDDTEDLYTADQMSAYAAQAVAAERERWQKWACRKEWDTVNDPPCHPGDKDWRPCANCAGPNVGAKAPT